MTPNLLPLYVVSFALMGILVLFARHNKKTGWVKQRPQQATSFQELVHMHSFAAPVMTLEGQAREASVEVKEATRTLVVPGLPHAGKFQPKEIAEFTWQLCKLQAALQQAVPVVPFEVSEQKQQGAAQTVRVRG